jgi:hypothetical protein
MCGLFQNCDSISPNEFEDAMMYEDGGSGSAVVEDASRLRHYIYTRVCIPYQSY